MRNKIVLKLFFFIFGFILLATPILTKAADSQIYLSCSNGIVPDNQWQDIYSHILYQDFPIRDSNLLLNSVGVRLYGNNSGVLVYAEIFTDDQHYIKQSARFVPHGDNWVYFNFGDKAMPVGNYHLWIWTNDGPGIYWGNANDASCDPYSSANIDALAIETKDMAYALYVKVASPINGSLTLFPGRTNMQVLQSQSGTSTAPAQDPVGASSSGVVSSGAQPSNNQSNLPPESVPPADQLSQTQMNPDPVSVDSQQHPSDQPTGIIASIKKKISSVFKPNSTPASNWQAPTDDEILRMTYGNDYRNVKLHGFFPSIILSYLSFLPAWIFLLILIIVIIVIIRRRKAKKFEAINGENIEKIKVEK